MVCDLPAGLEPQHIQGPRLFGRKVGEGGVGHVISLQVELVQVGQQLGDGTDALVSHVDAVLHSIQGSVYITYRYRYRYLHSEADEARREAGPESLLRDLVAAVDLEAVEALQELHEGLQASVRHVATP